MIICSSLTWIKIEKTKQNKKETKKRRTESPQSQVTANTTAKSFIPTHKIMPSPEYSRPVLTRAFKMYKAFFSFLWY